MVNVAVLKYAIHLAGKTQKQVYEEIGLTKRQWNRRIELERFDTDECFKLIKLLKIGNPADVFFYDDELFD